ncbi:hypothetical protein F5I97DRAFT_1928465 [Phlebopus sp. FC_14]|nr:hypothetical protein F5I97DRAFT_1928465 [Phlebopus sp. FC_14]
MAQRWNEFGDDGLSLGQKNSDHANDAHSDVVMSDQTDADDDGYEDEEEEGSSIATLTDASDSCPPFQVVVSHVCRHWRNVALSTPSLWTQINVLCIERPPFERVSTLLERSKSLPLDIRIDWEPPDDAFPTDDEPPRSFSEDDLKALLALLIPHVPRWGSIWVDVASYDHMFTFLSAVSDPSVPAAPRLEALQLYHHEDSEEFVAFPRPSMSKHFVLFGGSAPRLKSIALWGVHVDWNQSWITSGSHLLDLELAYHTEDVRPLWTAFNKILRGAPNLETLSLCLSGPSGNPPQWSDRARCYLVLGFHSSSYTVGLLRKLYTPVLKSLTLDFDAEDYTDLVTQLVGPATVPNLFPHEQPRSLLSGLEHLKISGLPCGSSSVKILYGELKNLKALNLSLTYLDPAFLHLLSPPPQGDILLPALKTLSATGAVGDAIRQLVQQRKEAGVPLKAVYLEESSEIEDEDIEWLKDNVEIFDFFEGSDDEEDVEDVFDEDGDEWSDED